MLSCSRPCQRELTCAGDPIPVVEGLALTGVVLCADGVGGAAWGAYRLQSCGEGRTAGVKMVFVLRCPCFMQKEKPSY